MGVRLELGDDGDEMAFHPIQQFAHKDVTPATERAAVKIQVTEKRTKIVGLERRIPSGSYCRDGFHTRSGQ